MFSILIQSLMVWPRPSTLIKDFYYLVNLLYRALFMQILLHYVFDRYTWYCFIHKYLGKKQRIWTSISHSRSKKFSCKISLQSHFSFLQMTVNTFKYQVFFIFSHLCRAYVFHSWEKQLYYYTHALIRLCLPISTKQSLKCSLIISVFLKFKM